MSYPFPRFLEDAANGHLPRGCTYTEKYDGFRLIVCNVDDEVAYFSKAGKSIRITDTPETMMEAIVLYVRTKFPGLSPDAIVDEYVRVTKGIVSPKRVSVRSRATELHFEFLALKDGRSYMRGLWTKECLDPETGRLNERDFAYNLVGFDCVFEEDGDDLVYWKRREVLAEGLSQLFTSRVGRAMVCEQVEGAKDMLDSLLTEEGLVFHEADGTCWKVKMPRVVMNLRIVAVANTIPGFAGYNLIYVAAPNEDGTWSVVHVFDWTDLFTEYENPSKGRPFINPKSVKRMSDGRLGCDSSCRSMQPLVNAVFRAVSGCTLLPAVGRVTKTNAVVRMARGETRTYKCGPNRSFAFTMKGLTNGPLFLSDHNSEFGPLEVIVGCSELWGLDGGELHLQPAWILALADFGPEAYMNTLYDTPIRLLRAIANDLRNDPVRNYQTVGLGEGPFLGLRARILSAMKPEFFFAPQ